MTSVDGAPKTELVRGKRAFEEAKEAERQDALGCAETQIAPLPIAEPAPLQPAFGPEEPSAHELPIHSHPKEAVESAPETPLEASYEAREVPEPTNTPEVQEAKEAQSFEETTEQTAPIEVAEPETEAPTRVLIVQKALEAPEKAEASSPQQGAMPMAPMKALQRALPKTLPIHWSSHVEEKEEEALPLPENPTLGDLFGLLLRSDKSIHELLLRESTLLQSMQHMLWIAIIGIGSYGLVLGWLAQSASIIPMGVPTLWLPVVLLVTMLGPMALCLPACCGVPPLEASKSGAKKGHKSSQRPACKKVLQLRCFSC